MTLQDGFEMKTLPEMDKNRIKINMEEGKSPKFMGEFKLYVGNIAFESTEEDLYSVFSEAGTVGDIALVRDDMGRNRGFGFVTMRTKDDGARAMENLDGKEMNGRNIAVRESNS
jgi:RNA recognition motif-containing protein